MAEAHSAVAFGFSVTHEGLYFDYNQELLHLIYQSVLRSYKRRLGKFKNNFRAGIYPASPKVLILVTTVLLGLSLLRIDWSLGLIPWLQHAFVGHGTFVLIFSSLLLSAFVWFLLVQMFRVCLKMLFSYTGWMTERQGKPSKTTMLWIASLNLLHKFTDPMLYSFQGSLPRLPLPSVEQTIETWLKTIRPLCTDEQFANQQKMAEDFRKGIGPKLQRYLTLKSWFSSNYVTDWWEEYVYLRGRSPIMINSNYYGLDSMSYCASPVQTARAAMVIHSALQFRKQIHRQELKPILAPGSGLPLCSYQYERMFNTTRIPGVETDILKHWDESRHVAVHHRGRWFKLPIHNGSRLLTPAEIEFSLIKMINMEDTPNPGEEHLGALTAVDRVTWAKARDEFFKTGSNKASLHAIEKAAFVVALDDEVVGYDENDSTKLDHWAHVMLHGKGYNRWFDKSINFVVCANGPGGLNGEHSWADAPVMAQLWEEGLAREVAAGYKEDGHCVGEILQIPPPVQKLKWELPEKCLEIIENSTVEATKALNDVDMALMVFKPFGKGFVKKCKVSPDAFIQMALQLAYFRDQGKFQLTYESAMTRLFREGRTETTRPVSVESCAFVRAMEDHSVDRTEVITLLRKACEQHVNYYRNAMVGKGVDRHLFCLYVVSKYLEIESPFLKSVLSEPWRLSTSQTPLQQTDLVDFKHHPEYISLGGGFGPVADDGYGVSYIIAGEDMICFHVSSKLSCETTSSSKFRSQIYQALLDMKELFTMTTKPSSDAQQNGVATHKPKGE